MSRDARRRNLFMDVVEPEVIVGSGLASARVPQSGMFVWIKINPDRHPLRGTRRRQGSWTCQTRRSSCMNCSVNVLTACDLMHSFIQAIAILNQATNYQIARHSVLQEFYTSAFYCMLAVSKVLIGFSLTLPQQWLPRSWSR